MESDIQTAARESELIKERRKVVADRILNDHRELTSLEGTKSMFLKKSKQTFQLHQFSMNNYIQCEALIRIFNVMNFQKSTFSRSRMGPLPNAIG